MRVSWRNEVDAWRSSKIIGRERLDVKPERGKMASQAHVNAVSQSYTWLRNISFNVGLHDLNAMDCHTLLFRMSLVLPALQPRKCEFQKKYAAFENVAWIWVRYPGGPHPECPLPRRSATPEVRYPGGPLPRRSASSIVHIKHLKCRIRRR